MENEIKKKYISPTPLLYLYRGKDGILNTLTSRDFNHASEIKLTKSTNETNKLFFKVPFCEDRKVDYDSCELLTKFEGEYYIIKNVVTDSGNLSSEVNCVHESEALKGIYCYAQKCIGSTPQEMFNSIVSSTTHPIDLGIKWGGCDVDLNTKRHLITEDEASVYENFVSLAKVFNGAFEIYNDENDQRWFYLRTKPLEKGRKFKSELDLKNMNVEYDSSEIVYNLYPTGYTNEMGIQLDVQEASQNPTHQSIISNFSYPLAKGVPTSIIDKEAQYQQLKILSDENYINADDLWTFAQEELKKCSVPTLNATISITDLSAYVDSSLDDLDLMEKILCIDKEIKFVFECQIVGIEKDYDNPLQTELTISNLIRYDTDFQNINHTVDTVDKIVSTSPYDTDGVASGDGSVYVPMYNVKDGDHVNVVMRIGETKTLITQTGEQINLRVDKIDEGYAQIKVESDAITSTVEKYGVSISEIKQTADSITSRVQDISEGVDNTYSEIKQTARKITAVVQEGDESGSWELSKDAFTVAFKGITNDVTAIDGKGIIAKNSNGSYTRLGSNGIEHLSSENGEGVPYHYWTQVGTSIFRDAFDIQDSLVRLEPEFKGSRVRGLASIKESKCEGPNALNWLASYVSEIDEGDLTATISGHANYRNLEQDDSMETSLEQVGGNITVSWMFIG